MPPPLRLPAQPALTAWAREDFTPRVGPHASIPARGPASRCLYSPMHPLPSPPDTVLITNVANPRGIPTIAFIVRSWCSMPLYLRVNPQCSPDAYEFLRCRPHEGDVASFLLKRNNRRGASASQPASQPASQSVLSACSCLLPPTHPPTPQLTIGAYTEMLQKYRVMEQSLQRQKVTLKTKMPEITNTLDLVLLLKEKQDDGEEMIASYPLSEIVHARAAVNCNGTVCLWLGANVMVEYTYEEAIAMLERNYKNAEAKLADQRGHQPLEGPDNDLEVNMARVFNYNVKAKRTGNELADAMPANRRWASG